MRSTYAINVSRELRRTLAADGGVVLRIEPGTTVEALLRRMPALGPPEAHDDLMLHVFVNGRLRGHDHALEPGDVLDFHLPVSGG